MGDAIFDIPAQSLGRGEARLLTLHRQLGLAARDRLYHLEQREKHLEAARAPVDERIERLRALEAQQTPGPWYAFLSNLFLDTQAAESLGASVRHAGSMRCARTALAIERYRLAHGGLPETLDPLVPELMDAVPLDPYAGEPLRYKREGMAYVIYSIGPDRRDDGGPKPRHEPRRRDDATGRDEGVRVAHPREDADP